MTIESTTQAYITPTGTTASNAENTNDSTIVHMNTADKMAETVNIRSTVLDETKIGEF
jgi:hypothetical protein